VRGRGGRRRGAARFRRVSAQKGEKRPVRTRSDMRRKTQGRPWALPRIVERRRVTTALRKHKPRLASSSLAARLSLGEAARASRPGHHLSRTRADHVGRNAKGASYSRAPDRDISVGFSRPRPSSSRTDAPPCTGTSSCPVSEGTARRDATTLSSILHSRSLARASSPFRSPACALSVPLSLQFALRDGR